MYVTAVIEIPQGSYFKYEVGKEDGKLYIDRLLKQPVPYNYGYIPNTLCGDGDPLDIFVVCDEPIHPLTMVRVEIVGALRCTDNGDSDDKILARIVGDSRPHLFGSSLISHYLETYKTGFTVHEILNQDRAVDLYGQSRAAFGLWSL